MPRAVFLTESDAVAPAAGLAGEDAGLPKRVRRASFRRSSLAEAGVVVAASSPTAPPSVGFSFGRARLKNAVKKVKKMNSAASRFDFPTIETVRLPKLKMPDGTVHNPNVSKREHDAFNDSVGPSSPASGPTSHPLMRLDSDVSPYLQRVESVLPQRSLAVPSIGAGATAAAASASPSGVPMFNYAIPMFPMSLDVSEVIEKVLDRQAIQQLDRLNRPVIDWFLDTAARDMVLDLFWLAVLDRRHTTTPESTELHHRLHHHLAVTFGTTFRDLTDRAIDGSESSDARGTREAVLDLFPSVSVQAVYYAFSHVFPHDFEKNVFNANFRRAWYQRVYFWTTGVVPQVAPVRDWLSTDRHANSLSRRRASRDGGPDGDEGRRHKEAQREKLKRRSTFHRAMLSRGSVALGMSTSANPVLRKNSIIQGIQDAKKKNDPNSGHEGEAGAPPAAGAEESTTAASIAAALGRSNTGQKTTDFVPTRHSGAGRWYEQGFPRGFLAAERVTEYEDAAERLVDLSFPLMPEVSPLGMVGGATGAESSASLPKTRPGGRAIGTDRNPNNTGGAGCSSSSGGGAGKRRSSSTATAAANDAAAVNAKRRLSTLSAASDGSSAAHDRRSMSLYAPDDYVQMRTILLGDTSEGLLPESRAQLADETATVSTRPLMAEALDKTAERQQRLTNNKKTRDERHREISHVQTERGRRRGHLGTHAPLLLYFMVVHLGVDRGDVHSPNGKPIPFTKLSEVDRASKGARFAPAAKSARQVAKKNLRHDAEQLDAHRRREQRDEETHRETEKRWKAKLRYVARKFEVATSARSEEHTAEATAVAKQLREALFEKGQDVHQIIHKYSAALERAQKIMFALPFAHRKLLWDIGLQCKLRLLHWQRSAPHSFQVLPHELTDAARVELDDLVRRITTRRPDLQLTRDWKGAGKSHVTLRTPPTSATHPPGTAESTFFVSPVLHDVMLSPASASRAAKQRRKTFESQTGLAVGAARELIPDDEGGAEEGTEEVDALAHVPPPAVEVSEPAATGDADATSLWGVPMSEALDEPKDAPPTFLFARTAEQDELDADVGNLSMRGTRLHAMGLTPRSEQQQHAAAAHPTPSGASSSPQQSLLQPSPSGGSGWSYTAMVRELDRQRRLREDEDHFSGTVAGFVDSALRRDELERPCETPEEVARGRRKVSVAPPSEFPDMHSRLRAAGGRLSVVQRQLESEEREKAASEALLGAVARSADGDAEEQRALAHRMASELGKVVDPAEVSIRPEDVAIRHGMQVIGANTLVASSAERDRGGGGTVDDANAAPKQHVEILDNDTVSKRLKSKLIVALGHKKQKLEAWQRTWTVEPGAEVGHEPPRTDPRTTVAPVRDPTALSKKRAKYPSPAAKAIRTAASSPNSGGDVSHGGERSPRRTRLADLQCLGEPADEHHDNNNNNSTNNSFASSIGPASHRMHAESDGAPSSRPSPAGVPSPTGPGGAPSSSTTPRHESHLPTLPLLHGAPADPSPPRAPAGRPPLGPRSPPSSRQGLRGAAPVAATTQAGNAAPAPLVERGESRLSSSGTLPAPEVVETAAAPSGGHRRHLETPPSNAARQTYRPRVGASMAGGATALHHASPTVDLTHASPSSARLPQVPLTARQRSNITSDVAPHPPAGPGSQSARPSRALM